MIAIGLTGGIASGKTTVSKFIRQMGIPVVCADHLARKVVEPGTTVHREIVRTFGREILNSNKTLNRAKLAAIVFASKPKRMSLNRIIHPEVTALMKKELDRYRKRGTRLVFLDIPLLFEEGLDVICDKVVLVYAPEKAIAARLGQRNGLSRQEIEDRLASQWPIEVKKEKADFVIDNSGDLTRTQQQVEEMVRKISKED